MVPEAVDRNDDAGGAVDHARATVTGAIGDRGVHGGRPFRAARETDARAVPRRRAALAEALSGHFPVELAAGGMHLLIRLPDGIDDGDVARRALAAGLAPTALSGLSIAHPPGHGLLLGFTNVREEDARRVVARLVAAIGG